MHELDLPRRYRTIFVCGGFGLGGQREHDVEGLRRIYEHLEPGGTFVVDNEVPYAAIGWKYWQRNEREELPRPWRDKGDRRQAANGDEIELHSRIADVDPLAQRVTAQIRALLWRDDEQVAEEEHTLAMTLYFTHELELMLRDAGFVDIELRGAPGPSADGRRRLRGLHREEVDAQAIRPPPRPRARARQRPAGTCRLSSSFEAT